MSVSDTKWATTYRTNVAPRLYEHSTYKLCIRVWGPPLNLLSDQEGGLLSNECTRMFDKLNINRLLVGTGGSTTKGLVERHIAITNTAMLKLQKQRKDEGLEVSLSDICYEACMAQKQMLEYAGGTPQLAPTGQHPTGFTPDSDTLAQITGALESRPDYIEPMYRTRLLAKQDFI